MNSDFLLVHKDILPDVYLKVIQARDYISNDGLNITDACKKVNISRSVYYKYKDSIFLPNQNASQKAILTFKTEDKPGVLNAILSSVSSAKANVLTINQDMPIHEIAYITLMIDYTKMTLSIPELVKSLHTIPYVKKVEVIAYE